MTSKIILMLFVGIALFSCRQSSTTKEPSRMKIIIDSDANNELDDQHALAYAFLNPEVFDVVGVTVNNTDNGAGLQGQYDEALRIIRLFNLEDSIPLLKGADQDYDAISSHISEPDFDGQAAVDFIIQEALKMKNEKLVLAPIGKLTNIALALLKAPQIKDKVKVVWLGGNYPSPGEYNLVNDISAVNPVIESGVEFEMVTVRYGQPTSTDAVRVTPEEVDQYLVGKGPLASDTIIGRYGGKYIRFGDYSKALFDNAKMHSYPPSRALFDLVVLAVLKNESWGTKHEIPAPKLVEHAWEDQPENPHTIVYWDQFNRDAIVMDFFQAMEAATPQNE